MSYDPARLDAARARLITWLKAHRGAWLSTSDHQIAKHAGLTDSDSGMYLLKLLEADGQIQVERDGMVRTFRYLDTPLPPEPAPAVEPSPPAPAREPTRRHRPPSTTKPQPAPQTQEETVPPPLKKPPVARPTVSCPVSKEEMQRIRDLARAESTTIRDLMRRVVEGWLNAPNVSAVKVSADVPLRPAIERAIEAARAEGYDIWALLDEVIDVGLTLRRMARPTKGVTL